MTVLLEVPALLRGPRRMAASTVCGRPSRLASLAPQDDVKSQWQPPLISLATDQRAPESRGSNPTFPRPREGGDPGATELQSVFVALDSRLRGNERIESCHRTATGATVEPVAPCSFSGCMMKANSERPFVAASSSLRFSNRCTPWFTSAIW